MTEPRAPTIEFPCPNYPIKVMGDAGDGFRKHVLEVMTRHSDCDPSTLQIRPSRNGRYESLTLSITATSKMQLQAIFEDLKRSSAVRMVL